MPRTHNTPGGIVPFTQAEEDAWDAREAAAKLPAALNAFWTKREAVVSAGVMHAGNLWHTNGPSQHAMTSALKLGEVYERVTGQPFVTIWKTMTASVEVSIADLELAGLVVGGYVQAAFQREDALIAQATGGDITGALAGLETGWPEGGA